MKYPVAIWNTDGVYTAEVPDLPGVVTEADSVATLETSVKEAAAGWMEAELDSGRPIPEPSLAEHYMSNPDYRDCLWMLIDIDIAALSDKTERVNICLPSRVLRRLDFLAANSGASRSGYLSQLVLCQSAR